MLGYDGIGGDGIGSGGDVYVGSQATLGVTLGACSALATGAGAVSGAVSVTLAPTTLSATNSGSIAGVVAIVLGGCTASSQGVVGIAAQASVALAAAASSAQGQIQIAANGSIVLGAVAIDAQASASSAVHGALAALLGESTLMANGIAVTLGEFIVEDGTGLPGAESYCTVHFADGYHAGRANSAWAPLSTADKQAKLRIATDFMQQAYFGKWKGCQTNQFQALDWPRTGAWTAGFEIAGNSVPVPVQRACAEYALRAIAGDLTPELGQAVKKEEVGPLKVEYQDGSTAARTYPALDRMVAPYFKQRSMQIGLVRA